MASKDKRKLAAIDVTREQVERITHVGPVTLTSDGGALVTVQVYVPRRMIDERVS